MTFEWKIVCRLLFQQHTYIYFLHHRFKNRARVDEVKFFLRGLSVPNPPVACAKPLLPAEQLPRTPPSPDHGGAILDDPEPMATTLLLDEPHPEAINVPNSSE